MRKRKPRARKPLAGTLTLRRTDGFTLIELMVVIAIISILIGALIPEFSGTFATMQLSAAAGQVGDMVAYCYSAACASQTEYRLNFDPEFGRVWITREMESETGERTYELDPTPGIQSYVLPGTIRFHPGHLEEALNAGEEGTYYIQFRRDGIADLCWVTLVAYQAQAMEVSLNGLTGRVAIREVPIGELIEQEETGAAG